MFNPIQLLANKGDWHSLAFRGEVVSENADIPTSLDIPTLDVEDASQSITCIDIYVKFLSRRKNRELLVKPFKNQSQSGTNLQ